VAGNLGILAVNTHTGMFYCSWTKICICADTLGVEVVGATVALAASQDSAIAMESRQVLSVDPVNKNLTAEKL
jgi:hypothetical protein